MHDSTKLSKHAAASTRGGEEARHLEALTDAGKVNIDLLLIKATSTLNLLDIFRRTYDGSHTDLPYVIYQKVKKFSITPYKESETGELEEVEEIIDVDGELKGCTPFTCEVMPQTLRIVL
ncbi:uncharacterized protein ACA1_212230 [Acanthamoeba castellanii str. Neff]|uniref:YegS/DAGK C-terminal domain-containing protein n=1 Tax=Acanthamoeba castellanii (strain ATCC 30010 / Neff) TaxID=1257118 RepID=L8GQ29_ACACF|nr:uncharacterized protein ACA1_212230 [Acanthamoeba castellanii str. Neff]ELR15017.1 hypothetical protein ACA1_212230 [Acanthamoeba castellanii str. Neff]